MTNDMVYIRVASVVSDVASTRSVVTLALDKIQFGNVAATRTAYSVIIVFLTSNSNVL